MSAPLAAAMLNLRPSPIRRPQPRVKGSRGQFLILFTPRSAYSGDTGDGSDNRAYPSPDARRSTPPSSSSPPASAPIPRSAPRDGLGYAAFLQNARVVHHTPGFHPGLVSGAPLGHSERLTFLRPLPDSPPSTPRGSACRSGISGRGVWSSWRSPVARYQTQAQPAPVVKFGRF